jgi:hypothetical protein
MSTVGRPTSMISFGMVFSTTWLEFNNMTPDPLVRREPVSASCNRPPDEGWFGDTQIQPKTQGTSSQLSLTMEAQKWFGGVSLMTASWI